MLTTRRKILTSPIDNCLIALVLKTVPYKWTALSVIYSRVQSYMRQAGLEHMGLRDFKVFLHRLENLGYIETRGLTNPQWRRFR